LAIIQPVVADAYIKAQNKRCNTLYDALQNAAGARRSDNAMTLARAVYYNALGYVPYNAGINENAARNT
jgi:hypothetical protein